MTQKKYVKLFKEGSAAMKDLLGGKGANLAEMTKIGLPVPPGFTVTTEACNTYFERGRVLWDDLKNEIIENLKHIEDQTNKKFGDRKNPLLVSVRSGAVVSMPGMMDTILNLGLNDNTVQGMIEATNNERFAWDCYRRFIQMFGNVVMGIEHFKFEMILDNLKQKNGVEYDTQLSSENLKKVVDDYKKLFAREIGSEFPQDPLEQLFLAVKAVFDSWNNKRAQVYRRLNNIPDHLGTAVNVQTMVFGNMGEDSGTGVAFTRNPSTGENTLYGEFLVNAQGEDVVAGIRTPLPIKQLETIMPDVFNQFKSVCELLEKHYRDMQDIEFTIERGKLYLLQTRTGKRTAAAAVKIAVDMVESGLITKQEAIMRVIPEQIEQLLHRRIDPEAQIDVIAKGLPASPGAACGKVVFDADEAEKLGKNGEKVILVRTETTPDDIHGIVPAQGILTSRGGMTSHAAVVARGMGKPCVCGCEALKIDISNEEFYVDGRTFRKGDIISIDGSTGNVISGEVPMIDPEMSNEFKKLLEIADEVSSLTVRANADTPEDAAKAREFGAKGIGLCRTEHMFMAQERLPIVQEMILAQTEEERKRALDKLLPFQQQDFEGILKAMEGYPVTIRLLDPPLHEFLPNIEELVVEITKLKIKGGDTDKLKEKEEMLRKVRGLTEFNPMLGHRGCRLGIVYPEIYEMQARAIFQAVVRLIKEGCNVLPEVMIPLVGHKEELRKMRELVVKVADQVMKETGIEFDYKVGTMIEIPRACVTADEIAEYADFFSFGTNDLTQTTFGFSRDDAEGKFLQYYISHKILPDNPFAVLDRKGVGFLIKTAVELGRGQKPKLKVGICGEHGGEPSSIEFCHQAGLDYVSCSPFRLPVARLSAAQSAVKE
ncbi:MAG: pyruvate, orthophosphate dikinase [Thermosediminibacterales bacterium]|nr:pyruvate, orthophosphate dikinase [Thermosediminibacterales bacterium]